MEEKKQIFYARTYRKISANRTKCLVYMGVVTLIGILAAWQHMSELTEAITRLAAEVLTENNPDMPMWTMHKTYPLIGDIRYLGSETTYPTFGFCLANAAVSFAAIVILVSMPWRGRPIPIYFILCFGIHMINSLWFVFAEEYFPYTLTDYSKLYMLQEIGVWIVFFIMTGAVTVIIGDKGTVWKLLTLIAVMVYSVVFGAVRYVACMYLLYKYSIIYMALCYFVLGAMFDFTYLVMIYGFFVNRMVRLYDSRKGKGAWKWS